MDSRKHVGETQLKDYARNGVVCLRRVFEDRWLDLVDSGIKRNLEDPKLPYKDISAKGATGRYLTGSWNWQQIPEFEKFARESPAAEIAGRLMQAASCVFLEDNWFVKEPGAFGRTPWHQDEPYYHVTGNFCSVWLPLDPVDSSNSLEFVKGSHQWGKMFMPANFEDLSARDTPRDVGGITYEITPNIQGNRESYDIVSWDLEPGDCLVFSGRTLHGAPGNLSTDKNSRRLSTRWADGTTRYFDKKYKWTSFVPNHGLKDGDLLRGDKFPVVWQREPGEVPKSN